MSCTTDISILVFDSIRGTSYTWTSYALFTWEIDSRQFLKDTYCYHFFINIIFFANTDTALSVTQEQTELYRH